MPATTALCWDLMPPAPGQARVLSLSIFQFGGLQFGGNYISLACVLCEYRRDVVFLPVRHDLLVSLDNGVALWAAQHGMGLNCTFASLMAVGPDREECPIPPVIRL